MTAGQIHDSPPACADGLIAELLPARVASTEVFGDVDGISLPAEEEAAIARAVDARRRAFTTARHCARESLGVLGIGPVPIPRGERGCPGWPQGIVGSITHCAGYRAAAVARTTTAAAVGIDAEPSGALPDGVLRRVASAAEREHVAELGRLDPGVSWDRLIFSAKEAIYKALYPLTRLDLGFADASVTFTPGTFLAVVRPPRPSGEWTEAESLSGHWLERRGLLVTTVVLDAWPPAAP